MKQSKKIAVTGGIGSGKSCVLRIVEKLGYPVYSCDEIYKELLKNPEFLAKINQNFESVVEDGKLNRQKLSKIVFEDKKERERLDKITHPEIITLALQKADANSLSFIEVPLLFEGHFEGLFDGVLIVLRERDERIKSIVERDKITKDEAILRINSQFNYDNGDFAKYYVIHNNSNLSDLEQNTVKIIKDIIKQDN